MKQFKRLIKAKGLKIIWLAEQCGISQPLMSMYLNETRIMPPDIEEKLRKLLS